MAIAYDNYAQATGSGSASASITTAGSNQIIFAYTNADGTESTPTVGGSSMTKIANANNGTQYWGLYYYVGTSAGSQTVAFSGTGTCYIQVGSYNGASQTGIPDAYVSESGANPKTTSITTVADNCWYVQVCSEYTNGTTIISGLTLRAQYSGVFADSNGVKTPAGSVSTVVKNTNDNTNTEYVILASFKPVSASGPANLKSINGLAKASIKSRNGLAIGSIKSINGLS